MAYSPSIGDVALVCQFAYNVAKKFLGAPSEVREYSGDCKQIGAILRQVDIQSKDRDAPMNRTERSRQDMKRSVENCNHTLKQLEEELGKFPSFATKNPSLVERAAYLTTNFSPLRDRLRQDRDYIETQLALGTNEGVGRILKAIRQLAADMKAGRKERTIVRGGRGIDDDDEMWTVIAQELELEDIPPQVLEQHRPEIEPIVRDMRQQGDFDEDLSAILDDSPLFPSDSVTEVGSSYSGMSGQQSRGKSEVPEDSISTFRTVPICDISAKTIFNPSVNARGIRIPDTFDVWEMAKLSWALQRTCTNGLRGLPEFEQHNLQEMVATLSKFDPVLLLCLAESSTDKNFWSRYSEYPKNQILDLETQHLHGHETDSKHS